jgi:hypothetical protein
VRRLLRGSLASPAIAFTLEPISKLENPAPTGCVVIPAQAGIQGIKGFLDARLRGHDDEWMLSPILR